MTDSDTNIKVVKTVAKTPSANNKKTCPETIPVRKTHEVVTPIEECLGAIYSLTCETTKKKYIGQAKLVKYKDLKPYRYGPQGRFNDHVSCASSASREYLISDAINDNGADDFVIDVLQVAPIHELDELEKTYISKYNTKNPNGYNKDPGGDNWHNGDRIDSLGIDKYNQMIKTITIDMLDGIQKELQASINNPYHKQLRLLKDKQVERIRIATAKVTSAPRQSLGGKGIKYIAVVVYVYFKGVRYAKDAQQIKFGGVTIDPSDAYEQALDFAGQIKLIPGGLFEDNIPKKNPELLK